jgi:type IV pilus assembly protein PilB
MAPKRRLGEILVEAGMIDDFQLRSALSDQKRWGRPLGVTLLKLGFLEEGEMVRVLSRQLDVPIVDLCNKRIAPESLGAIPIQVAEKLRCIPLFKKPEGGRDVLYLGMEDPTDLSVLDDLAFRTGVDIRPVLVGPNQLSDAIERHYHALEWDGEAASEPGLLDASEPGDTAPIIFHPEPPPAPEPDALGAEMLEGGAEQAAQAPEDEEEFSFAFDRPSEPASFLTDPEPPTEGLEAQSPPEPPPTRPRVLGPEFVQAEQSGESSCEARAEPAASAERPRDVPTRTILRAVTQLLIERGIFERKDLLEQIRRLEASEES